MRPTFYIHIGMPKAGSKSIQETMADNRETLLAHGINYLPVERNHGPFLISLLSDEPHKDPRNIRKYLDTPDKAEAYNADRREQLIKALSGNRSPKVVISGEGLSGIHLSLVRRLKQMLDPYAGAYRIIIYVRNPYEFANSVFLQRVKGGRTLDDAGVRLAPGYEKRITKYFEVFGRENVDIRIFDSRQFAGGDLIPDFLTALGEPASLADSLHIEHANQSMSHEAAVILSEANKAVPRRTNGLANRARTSAFHLVIAEIKGEKFHLDPRHYLAFEEAILPDLAWLNESLGKTAFEKPVPRAASVPRWSDETVQSIKDVVGEMAKTIDDLKAGRRRRTSGSVLQQIKQREKDFSEGLPVDLHDYRLPPSLHWLREAIGQPPSEMKPQFDTPTIRDLAVFLHSLALTVERLKAERETRSAGLFGRLFARAR
jgi:hypothetical protein